MSRIDYTSPEIIADSPEPDSAVVLQAKAAGWWWPTEKIVVTDGTTVEYPMPEVSDPPEEYPA